MTSRDETAPTPRTDKFFADMIAPRSVMAELFCAELERELTTALQAKAEAEERANKLTDNEGWLRAQRDVAEEKLRDAKLSIELLKAGNRELYNRLEARDKSLDLIKADNEAIFIRAEQAELALRTVVERAAKKNMLRLLGYVFEHKDAFSRPFWLCPQDTWKKAEELGYIEKGATKPFIARYGSVLQGYRLTSLGSNTFQNMLPLPDSGEVLLPNGPLSPEAQTESAATQDVPDDKQAHGAQEAQTGVYPAAAADLPERKGDAAIALLREWLATELDSQDEEYEPWIASFTERIKAVLASPTTNRGIAASLSVEELSACQQQSRLDRR